MVVEVVVGVPAVVLAKVEVVVGVPELVIETVIVGVPGIQE